MKLNKENLHWPKELVSEFLTAFQGNLICFESDKTSIVWRTNAACAAIDGYQSGTLLKADEAPQECMDLGQPVLREIPRGVYGARHKIYAIPVYDEEQIVGSFSVVVPLIHPIAQAFEYIAPLFTAFFPEGASLIMTDLQQYTRRVDSEKFTFDGFITGTDIKEDEPAKLSILSGKLNVIDYPAESYGVPVRVVAYPNIDNRSNAVTGNIVMCIPRRLTNELRELARLLLDDLHVITNTIGQLEQASKEMNNWETVLNKKIEELHKLTQSSYDAFIQMQQATLDRTAGNVSMTLDSIMTGNRSHGLTAREFKKLFDECRKSTVQVTQLMEDFQQILEEIKQNSQITMEASAENKQNTRAAREKIQDISDIADKLCTIAQEI